MNSLSSVSSYQNQDKQLTSQPTSGQQSEKVVSPIHNLGNSSQENPASLQERDVKLLSSSNQSLLPEQAVTTEKQTNDDVESEKISSSSQGLGVVARSGKDEKEEAPIAKKTYRVTLTIFGKTITDAIPFFSTDIVKIIEGYYIDPELAYQQGKELVAKGNTPQAFDYFEAAAHYGHRESQEQTASMLLSGDGATKDPIEALRFLRMAALHEGASKAWCNLAAQLEVSRQENDIAEAVAWYTKAAELGRTEARYSLGKMALEGRGQVASIPTAISWLSKAAEPSPCEEFPQAVIRANLLLSYIYTHKDQHEAAFHCLQEAASRRSTEAQLLLAFRYCTGIGTPSGADLSKAYAWLSQAATNDSLDENDASGVVAKHLFALQTNEDRVRCLSLLRPNSDFHKCSLAGPNHKTVNCIQVPYGEQNKTRNVCLEAISPDKLADAFADCGRLLNNVGIAWNVEFLDSSGERIKLPLAKVMLSS
jgi:TPR repeat protein